MSFGFGVGDFVTVAEFAWRIYQRCKELDGDFADLCNLIESMNLVVLRVKDQYSQRGLSETNRVEIQGLLNRCEMTLKDIDLQLGKYTSLGTGRFRRRDRLKFATEATADLRIRLVAHLGLLNSFQVSQAK